MISIEQYSDRLFGITSRRYSAALHKEAKATPGMIWNAQHHAWCGYADAVAVCVKRLEAADIIVNGEAPKAKYGLFGDHPYTVPRRLLNSLRKYQIHGVQFLIDTAATGALLADDMGLGKTAQTIRAVGALQRSALIVCPSFVRTVWAREIAKWLPKAPIVELSGTKPLPDDEEELRVNAPTFFICHYDIVHAWTDLITHIAAPEIVVFDECHYLMSEKSRRSVACREAARHAKYRIGLSGTPMTSRPRDLWNVVDTLSEGRFGKPFTFFLAHCNAHKVTITTRQGDRIVWDLKGASNLDELHERLSHFMLRRTKSEVELELPPRTRQVIEVEVPRETRAPIGNALKSDRALRDALALAADGKIPKAIELIVNHIESGSKVVVFSHRRAVAEVIATNLKSSGVNALVITGEVLQKRRVEIIDEQPTVLCATLDSTSVGIDLSYADVAVFVELDYVPSKLAQGESRLHRFGQKRNVLIQYVIALSTVDEVIQETVIAKLDTFEQVVGGLDDGLKETLKGQQLDDVAQLRKLYEKMKAREDDGKGEKEGEGEGEEAQARGRRDSDQEVGGAEATEAPLPARRKARRKDDRGVLQSGRRGQNTGTIAGIRRKSAR